MAIHTRSWEDEKMNVLIRVKDILDNAQYPTDIKIQVNMSIDSVPTVEYNIRENIAIIHFDTDKENTDEE